MVSASARKASAAPVRDEMVQFAVDPDAMENKLF